MEWMEIKSAKHALEQLKEGSSNSDEHCIQESNLNPENKPFYPVTRNTHKVSEETAILSEPREWLDSTDVWDGEVIPQISEPASPMK